MVDAAALVASAVRRGAAKPLGSKACKSYLQNREEEKCTKDLEPVTDRTYVHELRGISHVRWSF